MHKTTPLLLSLTLLTTSVLAQSAAQGTVLVNADFSNDVVDKALFGISSWNIPKTWELRDGALASIYDPKQHPGKAHGTSINPRIKARDVRVSYRVKFENESARLSMLINTPFPAKTGISSWLRSRLASVISSSSYILYALSYHDVPSSASYLLASWILSKVS
jgi:hypothetical protein